MPPLDITIVGIGASAGGLEANLYLYLYGTYTGSDQGNPLIKKGV